MKKYIVTTTINPPTKALKRFAKIKDWQLIVVGDVKTPIVAWIQINYVEPTARSVTYLTPSLQERMYPKLSKLISWNCIERRNIGILYAYQQGADIIALVDDDNIPYPEWGKYLLLDKKVDIDYYKVNQPAFDPISAVYPDLDMEGPKLWHRGFPLELVFKRAGIKDQTRNRSFDIQADFWNGDPDIDAIERLIFGPQSVYFRPTLFPFASNKPSPFNSQNTFLTRKVIPHYFLYPDTGRMQDIWASYYVQAKGFKVVYNKPSVYQDRNKHDLSKDLQQEHLGLENLKLLEAIKKDPEYIEHFLTPRAIKAWHEYRRYFK